MRNIFALCVTPLLCALVASAEIDRSKLPPAATGQVDFARDIKPIFDTACVKCHGKGKAKGGFSLETRDQFFKGGDSGNPVVNGKSAQSLLITLVSGLDPDNVMPKKGSHLKPEQVGLLRAWIDQGAKWPADITFKKLPIANLTPRAVALPSGKATNPIDRLLERYYQEHRVPASKVVNETTFARRVYLDVVGVLPTPEELDRFAADRRADKREHLVEMLLADQRRYAENWMTFWNDLLRNDYRGAGYIDGGRKQISTWLFSALLTNMPYDQFVRELVDPKPASEGFINGIVWRGAVNASQRPVMQAAQSIGQVFMGVNLKCASCHDSFINDYTLADSYGLAAIYATNDLEIAECDKPTGKFAKVKFLYPELGDIDGSLPKGQRTKRLAEILTARQDGRLTRTVVNRLWAKFMGRGLVEPVDEMDCAAWNADVLDWLAEDLADHGYDLKRTMRWILTSHAYQFPAVDLGEQTGKDFVFTGPAIRRMSAEQFRDSVAGITGVWFEKPAAAVAYTDGKAAHLPESARWIWSESGAAEKAPAETIYFRKAFTLGEIPKSASAVVACDNSFTMWVNGQKVSSGKDFGSPTFSDLTPHLRAGTNVIAIAAVNHTADNKPPKAGSPPKPADANPAGLFVEVRLDGAQTMYVSTEMSWKWTRRKAKGWEGVAYDDAEWKAAAELGGANTEPWKLETKLEQALALADLHGRVRSSLVAADPLQVALGRPSREQVMTARPSAATTLQALEMTNGDTFDKVLKRGATNLLNERKRTAPELIETIFRKSLGRKPTAAELKLAEGLVSNEPKQEGVEDLLWSVAMLPEFQLIY